MLFKNFSPLYDFNQGLLEYIGTKGYSGWSSNPGLIGSDTLVKDLRGMTIWTLWSNGNWCDLEGRFWYINHLWHPNISTSSLGLKTAQQAQNLARTVNNILYRPTICYISQTWTVAYTNVTWFQQIFSIERILVLYSNVESALSNHKIQVSDSKACNFEELTSFWISSLLLFVV
jgi:hypothetical protein